MALSVLALVTSMFVVVPAMPVHAAAPSVTDPGNQSNVDGDTVSLQIVASDPDSDPLTYSASGLPTGLSIAPATGLISGTIAASAAAGPPYRVAVTVSDGDLTDQAFFNWIVTGLTSLPAVFRDGAWFLRDGNTSDPATVTGFAFGEAGDYPLFGDWNGDGVATPGIVRDGVWYLRNSNSDGPADIVFSYGTGAPNEVPIVGDWDGDGVDTPGIVRGGNWWLLRNSNTTGVADGDFEFFFGDISDTKYVVGNWDGVGGDTAGIVRGNWFLLRKPDLDFFYGDLTDSSFVVGDWDGDGDDTPGILRGGWWLIRNTNSTGGSDQDFFFGLNSDTFRVWAQ